MKERKAYQDLPGSENPHFYENGLAIYKMLRNKYPNNTDEDLDSILNSLCASLVCLIRQNVNKDDWKILLQLVYNIININLDKK